MLFLDAPVATNALMWAGIVGFLSPIVIQFITSVSKDSRVQAAIAFAFELVIAIPTVYFAGNLDLGNYVKTALVVVTLAIAGYHGFWKPAGVTPSTTLLDRGASETTRVRR
jgi:hypothetical protein